MGGGAASAGAAADDTRAMKASAVQARFNGAACVFVWFRLAWVMAFSFVVGEVVTGLGPFPVMMGTLPFTPSHMETPLMEKVRNRGSAGAPEPTSESQARYLRAKELFQELLGLPPEKRRARLTEACGRDTELRREAESLLAHHDVAASSATRTYPGAPGVGRLLAGTLLAGRYRILDFLGRGAMGEVYRAGDTKLDVEVALKFLPEGCGEQRLSRFLNEVRTARQITHPNVCRVYDAGEAQGRHFLSMEYIDGGDLASLLRRVGRLPPERVLELAAELTAGLAAAHQQGILHRDLKPANLMVDSDGRARITDFGLAALAESVHGAEVRSGTPAYMAPEQHAGEEVSVRSDLYALGLVLYELTTGTPAFNADTLEELIRLHRDTEPTPPSRLVEGLDPALERVILSCLEKDPRERPASALEVAAALPGGDSSSRHPAPGRKLPRRRVALGAAAAAALVAVMVLFSTYRDRAPFEAGSPAAVGTEAAVPVPEPSILVLPFTTPGGDHGDGDFAIGITEDILTELSRVRGLKVMAQSATRRYRAGDQNPREIGRELGVAHVLMGSVRRAGNKVRIAGHLVDTVSERQLWSQAYDRELSDVFTIQQDVARRIASALGAELTAEEERALNRRPSTNPQAYELYLRGWERTQRHTYEDREAAIEFYRRAVAADPELALAWARLAATYVVQFRNGGPDRLEEAREAVTKALALDDELAEAHHARGMTLSLVGRLREALEAYRRTLEITPSRARTLNNAGSVLAVMGRWDEAFRELRRSIELDPLNPASLSNVAKLLARLGFHQLASSWFDRVLELEPYHVDAHRELAYGDALFRDDFAAARRRAAAIQEVSHGCCLRLAADLELLDPAGGQEQALELYRALLDDTWPLSMYASSRAGYLLRAAGKSREARPLLDRVRTESEPWLERGDEHWWHRWNLALTYATLDQPAEALRWYRDAVDAGHNQYRMDMIDPTFEVLRGEEAFQHQVERMRERVAAMRRRLAQSDDWEILSVPPVVPR